MDYANKSLAAIFNYSKLEPYEGIETKEPVSNKNVYVGIEIELEKVSYDTIPTTWAVTEDHSLKVSGLEFVSIPIRLRYLRTELNRLFGSFKSCDASSRCSVHVHMSIRDFTLEDLNSFLMLYCIFEKSLFRISGNRWSSNYCVPLYAEIETVKKFIADPFSKWYKYFALNLSPIWGGESKKYGTIEFRHMEGTTDVTRIMNWCNIIGCLKKAAKNFSVKDLEKHLRTMNTTSGYYWLAKEVFGKWTPLIVESSTFKEDVESCITRTKYIFLLKDSINTIKINEKEVKLKAKHLVNTILKKQEYINIVEKAKKFGGTVTNTTKTVYNNNWPYSISSWDVVQAGTPINKSSTN